MSSIGLNLPPYISDLWGNLGYNETLRRVQVQQRGADSNAAFNFYSSIVVALQAINGVSVPTVLTFGQAPSTDYCYGVASVPSLGVVGKISDWAVGKASINLAAVSTISLWAVGKASIPRLAVVAAAT